MQPGPEVGPGGNLLERPTEALTVQPQSVLGLVCLTCGASSQEEGLGVEWRRARTKGSYLIPLCPSVTTSSCEKPSDTASLLLLHPPAHTQVPPVTFLIQNSEGSGFQKQPHLNPFEAAQPATRRFHSTADCCSRYL